MFMGGAAERGGGRPAKRANGGPGQDCENDVLLVKLINGNNVAIFCDWEYFFNFVS